MMLAGGFTENEGLASPCMREKTPFGVSSRSQALPPSVFALLFPFRRFSTMATRIIGDESSPIILVACVENLRKGYLRRFAWAKKRCLPVTQDAFDVRFVVKVSN
jgi:hypothetical protein